MRYRVSAMNGELPPRARRILFSVRKPSGFSGTTSACAENTTSVRQYGYPPWNYLRVRGEYMTINALHKPLRELPPRARRIHIEKGTGAWGTGTTSACAENTSHKLKRAKHAWNYLRVRGEYPRSRSVIQYSRELPPRARRILSTGPGSNGFVGTTSACAENTNGKQIL